MAQDFIFYQFSRDRVERGDFRAFLSTYGIAKLPVGRRLRELMNSITFIVEGYDQDPRELYTIPEVRVFFQAFRREWPYWLYFCNLDTELLRVPVLACLQSLETATIAGSPRSAALCDPQELKQFLREDLTGMCAMCERAGMFDHHVQQRTREVIAYFQTPVVR